MPKISEIFHLEKTQHELDFININPNKDFPVYLNPFVFSTRSDPFSIQATKTVRHFFQHNLSLIKSGNVDEARANFHYLNEPNETCLGTSLGRPKGRGVGDENADDLFNSILNSDALTTGLVDHLEDTAIFIPGIGKDKVSDITTNIIRLNLIKYTQAQCYLLGIPMTTGVSSGLFWEMGSANWQEKYTEMLIIRDKKILLVPKGVVSYVKEFTHDKYHRHYALEFLQKDHLQRNTRLVQTTFNQDGSLRRRFVTKKDLIKEELASEKEGLATFTKKHPEIFQDFRHGVAKTIKSIPNSKLEEININQLVDHFILKLRAIAPGNNGASAYHTLMVGILEFIFYPNLLNPTKELEINEGRKRVDISFDNGAPSDGFFYRLQHAFNIPCPYIFVECKNYSEDIHNKELDQMVGRFSPNKGKFGIIVCRNIEDENLFIKRCGDSYSSQQGLIVPLTDTDLIRILEGKKRAQHLEEEILSNKSRAVMNQ